jgi:hypothetical protein
MPGNIAPKMQHANNAVASGAPAFLDAIFRPMLRLFIFLHLS